jgi:alkanesulfonate monooxygenase SsuD/methylene tetrahydromethanopterin reductase-like flavin-dependent oxidoreductase (luciferase family)
MQPDYAPLDFVCERPDRRGRTHVAVAAVSNPGSWRIYGRFAQAWLWASESREAAARGTERFNLQFNSTQRPRLASDP